MEKIDNKKCSKCRQEKPVEEFGKYKQCRSCLDYCRLYSKNNAEKRRTWAKEHIEKTKEQKQVKVFCDECKIEIQQGSWSRHIETKGHLANIGKDDKEFFEKTKWMKCSVCNNYEIQCKNYKRHTQTILHQENLKKSGG